MTTTAVTHVLNRAIRVATDADSLFLRSLQRKYSNQLGFLPGKALDEMRQCGRQFVGLENGEPAGYVTGWRRLKCQTAVAPIIQAAVAMDARRRRLGLALVEDFCCDAWVDGRQAVQCWCAADLEAVDFWAAAGFVQIAEREPLNARRRRLLLFRRPLPGCTDDVLRTPPRRAGHTASLVRPDRPTQWLLNFDGGCDVQDVR